MPLFKNHALIVLTHAKVLAGIIVDDTAGPTAVEMCGGNDELGYVERKETLPVKTPRIPLWQHKGLADVPLSIDVTEIGPCEKSVIATGTEHKPSRVRAPVVERLRIL